LSIQAGNLMNVVNDIETLVHGAQESEGGHSSRQAERPAAPAPKAKKAIAAHKPKAGKAATASNKAVPPPAEEDDDNFDF